MEEQEQVQILLSHLKVRVDKRLIEYIKHTKDFDKYGGLYKKDGLTNEISMHFLYTIWDIVGEEWMYIKNEMQAVTSLSAEDVETFVNAKIEVMTISFANIVFKKIVIEQGLAKDGPTDKLFDDFAEYLHKKKINERKSKEEKQIKLEEEIIRKFQDETMAFTKGKKDKL